MKFEEENYYAVENLQSFIYFLISDEPAEKTVVYVGQSANGLHRPFMHKDKEFNRVYIMPCSQSDLNWVESFYICKYKPKYNQNGGRGFISLSRARNQLKTAWRHKTLTVRHIRKACTSLGIQPVAINGIEYIDPNYLHDLYEALRR